MNCENIYCLYNRDNKCLLDDIELDIQGKCKSCIYTQIDDEYLNQKKQNK